MFCVFLEGKHSTISKMFYPCPFMEHCLPAVHEPGPWFDADIDRVGYGPLFAKKGVPLPLNIQSTAGCSFAGRIPKNYIHSVLEHFTPRHLIMSGNPSIQTYYCTFIFRSQSHLKSALRCSKYYGVVRMFIVEKLVCGNPWKWCTMDIMDHFLWGFGVSRYVRWTTKSRTLFQRPPNSRCMYMGKSRTLNSAKTQSLLN